jgi:ribosomal protein S18 acetylase RimI-like enzyme
MPIVMRAARADEAAALSQLALRSKAFWGYDDDFLAACRDELTFHPGDVGVRRMVVAEESGRLVGFYTLDGQPPAAELGNLWIEPDYTRRGIGRLLWRHALESARAAGFEALHLDADPNAEGFYLAMGAERIGEVPSESIPGRLLPRMRVSHLRTATP